jgi:hypothetical protein
MDDFVSVLKKGASGTGKGPVLLAAGFMYALVGAIGLIQYTEYGQAMVSATADWLPSLLFVTLTTVLPLLVTPYLLGGSLGYAFEMASGGKPGWQTFFVSARKHYLNLFFAGIIAFLIYTILAFVLILLVGSGSVLCCLALPAVIIVFVCLTAIEFYDIAIVADGRDFIKGFTSSVAFFRKHFGFALLFFAIVLVARFLVQLPVMCVIELKLMSEFLANYSYLFNDTANATNMTAINMTGLASQVVTFSVPSLIAIAAMQVILQTIVFAFVNSYKAEFYRWRKSIKSITDFDYEFPDEKKV